MHLKFIRGILSQLYFFFESQLHEPRKYYFFLLAMETKCFSLSFLKKIHRTCENTYLLDVLSDLMHLPTYWLLMHGNYLYSGSVCTNKIILSFFRFFFSKMDNSTNPWYLIITFKSWIFFTRHTYLCCFIVLPCFQYT